MSLISIAMTLVSCVIRIGDFNCSSKEKGISQNREPLMSEAELDSLQLLTGYPNEKIA